MRRTVLFTLALACLATSGPVHADQTTRIGGEALPVGHRILAQHGLLEGRGSLILHGTPGQTSVWVAWQDHPGDDYVIRDRRNLDSRRGLLRMDCRYNGVENPNILAWQPRTARQPTEVWMVSLATGKLVSVPLGGLQCTTSKGV